MQHTELLHRFFDEGIDEPLEDVLFGQVALDPELRREFIAHLKLHSIIQEDVAGITTPSHVSQQLFTTLGLTPPVMQTLTTAQRLRRTTGAVLLGMRTAVMDHRRYLYTAAISALATAILLFSLMDPRVSRETAHDSSSSSTVSENNKPRPNPVQNPLVQTEADASRRSVIGRQEDAAPGSSVFRTGVQRSVAVPVTSDLPETISAGLPRTLSAGAMDVTHVSADIASLPAPLALSAPIVAMQPEDRAGNLQLEEEPVQIDEVPTIDPPWLFSQPGPRTHLLSNLVVELRKYYGTSYPDVDIPHNSHKVFENMAISVVHKANEHHAFGFEYGRENFGRKFQRTDAGQSTSLVRDQSFEQIYSPPAQGVIGPQEENRMLDLFGAVWKLSLPEYGLFDIVYPYLRTFVGATKLGPLGKVRAGLEMYPSNFSMLNVGIEGGMLRYTVDDMSYYTTKLNFTFGVAIGF
ncbi:MAG: hypothetical protein WC824_07275 [Bacteroidota bacterium]|jgi:hypothetical protein